MAEYLMCDIWNGKKYNVRRLNDVRLKWRHMNAKKVQVWYSTSKNRRCDIIKKKPGVGVEIQISQVCIF